MATYSELRLDRIQETITALQDRIEERFPDSGLSHVCAELMRLANETSERIERLRRPIWPLRIGAGLGIAGIMSVTIGLTLAGILVSRRVRDLASLLQASESAVNEIILLALGIFFLLSLENRVKRREALRALHRHRSLAHIVDMHQLTKDPERHLIAGTATTSSPKRSFTRFELGRYLDYCAELLSLNSKLAALHVQYLNDPVVLSAVNDIEELGSSLSNKIWQKIMILDIAIAGGAARRSDKEVRFPSAGADALERAEPSAPGEPARPV